MDEARLLLWYEHLNNWAMERFGQYWEVDFDPFEIEEQFARWVESRYGSGRSY
jgi:hypothetical protein